MRIHEAFRPLVLSKMLRETLDEINKHRKDFDKAQEARIQLALDIFDTKDVELTAYPDGIYAQLQEQMKKQKERISGNKQEKK